MCFECGRPPRMFRCRYNGGYVTTIVPHLMYHHEAECDGMDRWTARAWRARGRDRRGAMSR
jgi:hypothetical protein